jgi:hypothetical protein
MFQCFTTESGSLTVPEGATIFAPDPETLGFAGSFQKAHG